MRNNHFFAGSILALVLGVLAGTQCLAQPKPDEQDKEGPGYHKLTIQTGPTTKVNYFPKPDASASDKAALRELEQAENDVNYANDLQALKQQYLATDRALEPKRRAEQLRYYGMNVETDTKGNNKVTGWSPYFPIDGTGAFSPFLNNGLGNNGLFGNNGFGSTGLGFLGLALASSGSGASTIFNPKTFPFLASALGSANGPFVGGSGFSGGPLGSGFPGFGGFGLGYPFSPYGTYANLADLDAFNLSTDTKVTHSVERGIGPEGAFKTAMVAEMAKQSSPEYLNSAARRYEGAMTAAAYRDTLRKGGIQPAAPGTRPCIVHFKDGRVVAGVQTSKDAQFVTVETKDAERAIRLEDVAEIEYPKAPKK